MRRIPFRLLRVQYTLDPIFSPLSNWARRARQGNTFFIRVLRFEQMLLIAWPELSRSPMLDDEGTEDVLDDGEDIVAGIGRYGFRLEKA